MKNSVVIGSYSLALAIVLGAFGAHGLKSMVSIYALDVFNKAVYYQVIHSIGLLFSALLLKSEKSLKTLRILFLTGMIGFSGSLYILTFADFLSPSMKQVVGPITPIGGIFFVMAWVYLAIAARKELINWDWGEQ